jgi:hypothetical protein
MYVLGRHLISNMFLKDKLFHTKMAIYFESRLPRIIIYSYVAVIQIVCMPFKSVVDPFTNNAFVSNLNEI